MLTLVISGSYTFFKLFIIKLLKLEAEGAEPEILLGGLDKIHLIDYICADVGPERGLSYETTLVSSVIRGFSSV